MPRFYGTRGNAAEVTGPGALHTTGRPMDYTSRTGGPVGGAFSMGLDNGTTVMTAGAQVAQEIYQMRWAPPASGSSLYILKRLRISMGAVVAFAAGQLRFRLFKAKAWTVNGTLGTQVLPTANQNKRKTGLVGNPAGLADSLLIGGGDQRIAATVPLGPGTKVLETVCLGSIAIAAPTTVGPILTLAPIFEQAVDDDWPTFFEPNEGLALQIDCPGTGTWYHGVYPEWVEVDDFR